MTVLSVPDISCNHCKVAIESALGAVAQSGTVTVDVSSRTVAVSGPAPVQDLLRALDQAGYPASLA